MYLDLVLCSRKKYAACRFKSEYSVWWEPVREGGSFYPLSLFLSPSTRASSSTPFPYPLLHTSSSPPLRSPPHHPPPSLLFHPSPTRPPPTTHPSYSDPRFKNGFSISSLPSFGEIITNSVPRATIRPRAREDWVPSSSVLWGREGNVRSGI